MDDQVLRTNQSMLQAITNEQFRELIRMAEEREKLVSGTDLHEARKSLAWRWKVAPGTLSNIRRGRVKDVRTAIRNRIGSGIFSDLGKELARINHERQLLIQCGFGPDSVEIHAADTVIAKVREAYEAMARWRG